MEIVLKSNLFGDRKVNINMPNTMRTPARTGEGVEFIDITRNPDGYKVVFHRRGKSKVEVFDKREQAAQAGAKFLFPVY